MGWREKGRRIFPLVSASFGEYLKQYCPAPSPKPCDGSDREDRLHCHPEAMVDDRPQYHQTNSEKLGERPEKQTEQPPLRRTGIRPIPGP